jgi:hypothetical protein
MLNRLYFTSILLIILVLSVLVDYLLKDNLALENDKKIVKTTNLAYPALGVSWYEPRVLNLDKDKNPIYFDMPSPNRLNFLY